MPVVSKESLLFVLDIIDIQAILSFITLNLFVVINLIPNSANIVVVGRFNRQFDNSLLYAFKIYSNQGFELSFLLCILILGTASVVLTIVTVACWLILNQRILWSKGRRGISSQKYHIYFAHVNIHMVPFCLTINRIKAAFRTEYKVFPVRRE